MRLDKWIWAVRLVKTRTKASDLCKINQVTINGVPGKAAKMIKVGDVIEVDTKKNPPKIYRVEGFIAKPSTPERVAQYFTDLTPKVEEAETKKSAENFTATPAQRTLQKKKYNKDQGRPVKRDRRALDRLDSMWD